MSGKRVINPDDFLETETGRMWTSERNAQAWARSYELLEELLTDRSRPYHVSVVCGIQGAGKTTWISDQPLSVSRIYFDAALPGARHRARIIEIAKRLNTPIDAVWIKTPLEVALERNARRASDKVVPVTAIHAVAGRFEEPTTAEGFDHVLIVEPDRLAAMRPL